MSVKRDMTLLELQSLIRKQLDEAFPMPVWVTAEISELKVNNSGHCYIELVEKGGDNQVPRARASAVIWRSAFGSIDPYFRSATGSPLGEGMKVLVKASVNYHEMYGLSLVINDIDPLYTLGDMQRQRQETILRLQEEGIYDMNRSLDLPTVIQRIAVLSSANAAGYRDFIEELSSCGYRFELTLFDSVMQGHGAEESVIASLEAIASRIEEFDVVVLIRGGGSQSDLAVFSSYRLCCHLAQFPLPVITGIGHDKDQNVADLVAAVSLKTPTAVAGFLASELATFDQWLETVRTELLELTVTFMDERKRELQRRARKISDMAVSLSREVGEKLERMRGELRRLSGNMIINGRNLASYNRTALRKAGLRVISDRKNSLALMESHIESRDPARILQMGFAVVRKSGGAVTSALQLDDGDIVDVTLARGAFKAEVKNKNNG